MFSTYSLGRRSVLVLLRKGRSEVIRRRELRKEQKRMREWGVGGGRGRRENTRNERVGWVAATKIEKQRER
jgi:hypothetical protein